MLQFDADQPVNTSDLSELRILNGSVHVDKEKSDEIVVSADNITIHFIGDFVIGDNGTFVGTMTGLTVEKNDLPDWDISKLDLDIVEFLKPLQNQKGGQDKIDQRYENTITDLFAGGDKIAGSHMDDRLYGLNGNDKIKGWRGDDIIFGGNGRDTLTGYLGDDSFVFKEKLNSHKADTITDFKPGQDDIWLKHKIFDELPKGTLHDSAFIAAHDAKHDGATIIYRPSSGDIFYDPDGTGHLDKTKFATVDKHLDITHSDFLVY